MTPSMSSSPLQAGDPVAPLGAAPRHLTDDVLQTAEEAVVSNPASADAMFLHAEVPETAPATGETAASDPGALTRYVADNPSQSALMALAAGAMAAALLRSAWHRRRR